LWVILGSLVPTLLAEALGLGTVVLGSTFVIAVLGGSALLPMPRLAWPRSVPATSPSTSVG